MAATAWRRRPSRSTLRSQAFIIENHRPEIVSVALTTAVTGQLYRYDVDAVDPDLDPLTYELTLAPAGMAIDAETGVIGWVPEFDQIGMHSVSSARS